MIIEIKQNPYLYQKDDDIEKSKTEILEYFCGKNLSRSEITDALEEIEKGGLYKFVIDSIPYEYEYWGDIFTDYEDRVVAIDISELIDTTNILDLFK